MSRGGLLNEKTESEACLHMIAIARQRVKELDAKLSATEFDRENYLRIFSRRSEAASLLATLEDTYGRIFNT